ncbi:MAG: hypothetical protein NUV47_01855 [Patescibacteria group bacterium]|nr:hypothetical protein [Patescibacteria group bacterium]
MNNSINAMTETSQKQIETNRENAKLGSRRCRYFKRIKTDLFRKITEKT